MTPSIYSIPPFISAILFIYLGLFVFFKNPKSPVHLSFFIVSIVTFIWEFNAALLFNETDPTRAIIFAKLLYIGVTGIPVALLHFYLSLFELKKTFHKVLLFSSYAVTSFYIISIFATDLMISGTYTYFWGFYPKVGPLHPSYLVFLYSLVGYLYFILFKAFKNPKDSQQHQYAKASFWAFSFYALASADFLANYGIQVYPFGFAGILLYLTIIAYSIVRYHLFNMRAVVAEILTLSLLIILGLRFFFANMFQNTAFDFALLGGVSIIGIFLIKSVASEVRQKEELSSLNAKLDSANKKLADLNNHLEEKVEEQTAEVRKAYEVEKKARIELEELDKAKDQFILTAQHHLRTPLTVIKGFLQMALDKQSGLDDDTRTYLVKASDASEKMKDLINDFLNISQVEVGKALINPEPTDISSVIEEIKNELKPNIEQRHLSFKVSFTPEAQVLRIPADRRIIKAALFNLIDNAVKYTQEGGVSVLGVVFIHPIDKKNFLRIEIKDTGIGISKDDLLKIFNHYFERTPEAQKMYATGRGLGLALSKNMIQLHGGRVFVESEGPGKGSIFTVELPTG
ncbi:MAG: ATP-binding protein [Patescibacteria group bacterium]|nr:ATP-binding protein [bacterium]MDZ4240776.1 ATP-binding protein [Patescibacteria group bacterium]